MGVAPTGGLGIGVFVLTCKPTLEKVMNAKYLRRGLCEFSEIADCAVYQDDADVNHIKFS